MSFVSTDLPCPCGKSSDAYAIDDRGWGTCFSCSRKFKPKGVTVTETENSVISYDYLPQRGLTAKTCEKWGILTKTIDGVPAALGYQWPNGSTKQRNFTEDRKQRFVWVKNHEGKTGDQPYGWWLRRGPDHVTTLVITEGMADAASLDQVTNGTADCISIDSVSTVHKDLKPCVEELNRYRRIILAFDDDDPGTRAVNTALSLVIDPSKVYRMRYQGSKDANELLQKDAEGLRHSFLNPEKVTSTDFIHTFTEVAESLKEEHHDVVATYPLENLQTLLRGLVRGRVTVWKGLEGIGKTEVFRLVEHHTLKTSDAKIAVIHMEESKDYTIRGLATYELGTPMYFEEDGVSEAEVFEGYKSAVGGDENRFFIYKVEGSDNPDDILLAIRSIVVTTGVDVVFLDNMQKMVDGVEEESIRHKLTYLSSKLKDMAGELGFALEVISHVNDDGKILHSRYIGKVFDRVIQMSRNLSSEDEVEKNTVYFNVEKNRGGKGSGKAGSAYFNPGTYTLEAVTFQ